MLTRELLDDLSPLRVALGLAAAVLVAAAYVALETLRGGTLETARTAPTATPAAGITFAEAWRTDFGQAEVPLSEFVDGGMRRGTLLPISEPAFQPPSDASWLNPSEPVVAFLWRGDARAYPLRLLVWHQLVNDVVGGQPVAIVYSPFLASAAVLDRVYEGQMLTFGVTGQLRRGDIVLFDEGTESWWQGLQGRALVGESTGAQLEQLPSWLVSWQAFQATFPEGLVMATPSGSRLPYGHNPYGQTDGLQFYQGPQAPSELLPEARVLGFSIGQEIVAYPLAILHGLKVVNTQVAGTPVVIFAPEGPADPLQSPGFNEGPPLEVAYVYQRQLADRLLSFTSAGQLLIDKGTGSRWNALGEAVEGPLAGERLTLLPHLNAPWAFWWAINPAVVLTHPGF